MSTNARRRRHHEDYPLGFGSPYAVAATAIAPGDHYIETGAELNDPLATHGGVGVNLCIAWNQLPADATSVDVVVHLHGYSAQPPNDALLRAKVAASGIDLAGRSRPTIGIIARGRKITSAELAAEPKANAQRYTFPALTSSGGAGLERVIAWALDHVRNHVLPAAPAELSVDRLIFTAHSGGGAPLNQLLRSHDKRAVCNPHEVHVFDALYGPVDGLTAWVKSRLAADRALAADQLPESGGALRIAYRAGEGTEAGSRAVAAVLPAAGDPLHAAYRAESTPVAHGDIPRSFGPALLTDARSELVAHAGVQSLSTDGADWETARALAADDDARSWLDADADGRAALDASVASWIAATDRSGIELIADADKRKHFLEEVDWSKQHFKKRGKNIKESEALFNEMAKVVPERRVPTGIKYHNVDAIVETVPDTTRKLFPEAKDAFVRMRDAAKAAGLKLKLGSSWRSEEKQQEIRDANPGADASVAMGTSAHTYGLAVDLHLSVPGLALTNTTKSMAKLVALYRSPIYKWLALHAREFGFFPYRREPWHWEYNPPGFKERFEAAIGRVYGAPVGLIQRYREHPPAPVAEAKGEVPGDIDPRLYEANSFWDAIKIIGEWLLKRMAFTVGVQNTTIFPHSAICQLRMKLDGGTAQGTGFYVAPNRILTAAHNIVIPGHRLESIEVFPGKTNDMSTFGSFTVTDTKCFIPHPKYDGDDDFDIAVVRVGTKPPNGDYFQMEELRMSPVTGIAVCGYAAEGTAIDRDRQHMDIDTIRDLYDETFTYALHARRGTSGSPTFYILGQDIKAVGVLSRTGGDYVNVGCRLTDEKIKWINSA